MKGFAITPVLFVGLFLVTGIVLVNFMDLDKRMAEGIGAESRMKKLAENAIENETSTGNLLMFYSIDAAASSSTESEMLDKVNSDINGNASLALGTQSFDVSYSYTYSDAIEGAKISKGISVAKHVTCSMITNVTLEDVLVERTSGGWLNCTYS